MNLLRDVKIQECDVPANFPKYSSEINHISLDINADAASGQPETHPLLNSRFIPDKILMVGTHL
jgi:hypothetical protein